jgi:hypothetical protein
MRPCAYPTTEHSCFLLRTCRSQDALQPTDAAVPCSAVQEAKQRDMAQLAGMLGQGGWQQLSRQEQAELARWAPGWCEQAQGACVTCRSPVLHVLCVALPS